MSVFRTGARTGVFKSLSRPRDTHTRREIAWHHCSSPGVRRISRGLNLQRLLALCSLYAR